MATNLLNGSIYDYYGISYKLKAMDVKKDRYAENQWNYYTSIFSGPFSVDKAFGGTNPFIENYSSYGIKNPLDAVALGLWQSGLEQASGTPYAGYRTGSDYSRGLGSTLYTLSDTHLDALNYDDKWLRTQAGAVMNASNLLKQYVTRDNGDGTYNLTITPGADLGYAGRYSQVVNAMGNEVTNPDMYGDGTVVRNSSGPRSAVSYENVKLFNDIDAAYNYVRNESSFLYDIKKAALERTASNTDIGPTGEQARLEELTSQKNLTMRQRMT